MEALFYRIDHKSNMRTFDNETLTQIKSVLFCELASNEENFIGNGINKFFKKILQSASSARDDLMESIYSLADQFIEIANIDINDNVYILKLCQQVAFRNYKMEFIFNYEFVTEIATILAYGVVKMRNKGKMTYKEFIKKAGCDASKHMIAVTSETSPLAHNPDYMAAFYMDDYIGGRYSSTSGVGGAVLSLAFGPKGFQEFLDGAAEEDKLSLNKDITKNPALMDALIGVYERNVQEYPATAILPYSQALSRFPAHLQQLDMESNGKSVNRFGEKIDYVTGPVIFGEPGTNGQHSFYQLLHQGTDIVPLQFIAFKENQTGDDVVIENSTSQVKLCANVTAQIVAFACGKNDENPNKKFDGGRPSSLIYGDNLNPKSLGALLAHFENKVMFQGFVWNVNSFDQEGVQLGKVLAKTVLSGKMEGALKAYANLLIK